jgi:hypothetical protein
MTTDQVLKVIGYYQEHLDRRFGAEPEEFGYGHVVCVEADGHRRPRNHLASMCDQIRAFIEADEVEKAMRWLGFMQGAFWALGVFTLNDLRQHNAPGCKEK